jgi:hypothetical protein
MESSVVFVGTFGYDIRLFYLLCRVRRWVVQRNCGCWLTILKVKLSRPQSHRGNCGVGALSAHVFLGVLVTLTCNYSLDKCSTFALILYFLWSIYIIIVYDSYSWYMNMRNCMMGWCFEFRATMDMMDFICNLQYQTCELFTV